MLMAHLVVMDLLEHQVHQEDRVYLVRMGSQVLQVDLAKMVLMDYQVIQVSKGHLGKMVKMEHLDLRVCQAHKDPLVLQGLEDGREKKDQEVLQVHQVQ